VTSARLWASGLLAMVGGFLMIWSGYVSRGLLYQAIGAEVPAVLSGVFASTALLVISILELINALGGVTVIVGGLVLVSGHARTGRIVILLGGGAGFLGLLVTFGYSAYKLGVSQMVTYAPYWVGLVLAVVARRVAKGAHSQVKQTAATS
jgi:hypothetical protein